MSACGGRPPSTPTVIVLAAGRSERFLASGGHTHKLQARLGGIPILQRVLQAVERAGLACHVVRPRGVPADGMGDSIARGVRATPDSPGWLILPGDLPLIDATTLRRVARALTHCPVVVPVHDGRPGHPVGFGAPCGARLLTLTGERGAASIVQDHRRQGHARDLVIDDIGAVTDIDTAGDLAAVAATFDRGYFDRGAGRPGGTNHGQH